MGLLENKYFRFLVYVGGTIQVITMLIGVILATILFGIIGVIFYHALVVLK